MLLGDDEYLPAHRTSDIDHGNGVGQGRITARNVDSTSNGSIGG
jgi:hypothetical protein